MEISDLKSMIKKGLFHHATYRNQDTLWEGLWIYKKDPTGFRGFSVAGSFLKSNPEQLKEAEKICVGVSVGSYSMG